MRPSLRFRPSPATVLSGLALFFALGGSAWAVGGKMIAAAKPQPRCAAGAVRGIAVVTGDPLKGIANIPGEFTSDPKVFSRKFNCTGGPVQVRRAGNGSWEVRFVGNPAQSAVAAPMHEAAAGISVQPLPGGSFRVWIREVRADRNVLLPAEVGFVIVAL